jgi:hypothetical protein
VGYERIRGELKNLRHQVGGATMKITIDHAR